MDQAEELRNVKTESENKEARQDHHCHKWKGRCGKIQHCRKSCSPVSADGVENDHF